MEPLSRLFVGGQSGAGSRMNFVKAVTALCLFAITYYFYDIRQPIMKYMEFLPVYRAERIYAR